MLLTKRADLFRNVALAGVAQASLTPSCRAPKLQIYTHGYTQLRMHQISAADGSHHGVIQARPSPRNWRLVRLALKGDTTNFGSTLTYLRFIEGGT